MIIRLEKNQKAFEELLSKMLQSDPSLRIDGLQVLYELCLLKEEPFEKHLELEEEKQNSSGFTLKIKSANAVINDIITELGDYNYGAIDKIHPNKNRIFSSLIKYTDNSIYQGEYDQVIKQRDGRGRQIWRSGEIYDGLWKNNLTDGLGRYIYANGNYYIGEYKAGKKNGFGKYYWKHGDVYSGQQVQDKQEGLGQLKYSNMDLYYGQWANGEREGVGVYIFNNGDIDLGQYMNSQKHGIQIFIPKNAGYLEISKYYRGKHKETLIQLENPVN
ncbi:morn repeat protein [Stylonychia lemnae]|uniref:Morn repeat protein n=1 Tax=Stylonychia lemnae TaxID=5949 RepID=A0A078BBE6_STYLE|nr:morn repeat protein [Stylonychia lemnae]|eukprot:CDW91531.1 morn repeat protein [Stylonychia lemnae]